ncbi:YkoF family thiamine/hydroxymethylpyrimidine-binding protein [Melioribacter sp. OK-6-Me]|uniref:YkoF family thiamine/hydroxymethylpyrimidine-binding protein n=1 Tax=unclassified Melioribacter TaxID=2627329 RepID=UPI003EDA4AEA
MTCEIAFIPLGSEDYIADVERVLEIIRKSDLEFKIGEMSTLVKGEANKIFSLLKNIFDSEYDKTKFIISVRMSNVCGC